VSLSAVGCVCEWNPAMCWRWCFEAFEMKEEEEPNDGGSKEGG
jgi:hypothetical protein